MARLLSNAASGLATVIVALVLTMFAASPALAEDYTLDTGDALRIAVFGEPAYPIDVSVDDRGTVSLPLLGDVEARGMTTKDLAQRIRQSFQDQKLLIDPFIQVDVKEYRPFFISGAVSNPGSYPYKPGITIRHALAIAGGFKAMTIDNEAPALRIADLRAERANLLVEEFRYRTKLHRLHAESAGEKSFAVPADRPLDIAPQLLNDIVGSEVQQLEARRAAHTQDLAHLQASLERASKDAELLGTAMKERESAASYQMQQLESARKLQKQGLVTNSNLLTAERAQNS